MQAKMLSASISWVSWLLWALSLYSKQASSNVSSEASDAKGTLKYGVHAVSDVVVPSYLAWNSLVSLPPCINVPLTATFVSEDGVGRAMVSPSLTLRCRSRYSLYPFPSCITFRNSSFSVSTESLCFPRRCLSRLPRILQEYEHRWHLNCLAACKIIQKFNLYKIWMYMTEHSVGA